MRPKSLALLLLALGCGLVASIGITEVIARRNVDNALSSVDTQSVLVAMTDVGMGDVLSSQVLKLEQWPKDKIPSGAISRIEEVEGRRTRARLYSGEPILQSKLLGKGSTDQGATALIPKGYRVVPIKVDLVSGGSSLILPGDRVDVMVHLVRDPGRDIPETVTRTILQDIKVFAVNDVVDLENGGDKGHSITAMTISLLLTPEQAARVMLAVQMGTVNLIMRSSEDDQQTANVQARPAELLQGLTKNSRSKEDGATALESSLQDKTKGFMDFLSSMKPKPQAAPETQAAAGADQQQPPQSSTWTMRLLKPDGVDEIQFESGAAVSKGKATKPGGMAIDPSIFRSGKKDAGAKAIPPSVRNPLPSGEKPPALTKNVD